MKLAFAKALAYKKSKQPDADLIQNLVSKPVGIEKGSVSSGSDGASGGEIPSSVKLAMEKAREYNKNKGVISGKGDVGAKKEDPGAFFFFFFFFAGKIESFCLFSDEYWWN